MAPMAAPELQMDGALPGCYSSGSFGYPAQVLSKPAPHPSEAAMSASAAPPSRQGSIFTEQLWKAVGLDRKPLGRQPVQCAANSAVTLARAATAASAGGLTRLMSGGSSFGSFGGGFSEASRSSVSSGGFASRQRPTGLLNPKSLKMAAIMAYEASCGEGSEASGALSDSTGVSPAAILRNGSGGSSHGRRCGSSPADSNAQCRGGCGDRLCSGACAGECTPLGSRLQNGSSGCDTAAFGTAEICCVSNSASMHSIAAAHLGAAASAVKDEEPMDCDPAALEECLLCGSVSVSPSGSSVIRCSDCCGAMHRECFIAHYQVVPSRRDWTYCPAHSMTVKAAAKAAKAAARSKKRAAAAAARRAAGGSKRQRDDDDWGDDSDDEWVAGGRTAKLSSAPSGSRSQRPRRAAASAAVSAAAVEAGGVDLPLPPQVAAYVLANGDGSSGDLAAGDGLALKTPAARLRPAAADGGSGGTDANSKPAAGRQPASPVSPLCGGSESGSVADGVALPASPPAQLPTSASTPATATSEARHVASKPRARLTISVPKPAQQQRKAAAGGNGGDDSDYTPSAARTPRAAGIKSPARKSAKTEQLRSPRSPAAAAVAASPRGGSRKASVPPVASAAQRQHSTAAAGTADVGLKSSSAELADEELAMLLHQELNAPSRRRGSRQPNATTPAAPRGLQ